MIWDVVGGLPADYEARNLYTSARNPNKVHAQDAGLTLYFERYLLQKAISVFKFENLPEDWSETYFLYSLFLGGFLAVLNTDQFGIICQGRPNVGLCGKNIYFQPTNVTVANPLLNTQYMPRIGYDTELIKLTPDYRGLFDIISYYAENMAIASATSAVNLLNSQLSYIIGVDDKKAAAEFKKLHQSVASGEPSVVLGKKLFTPEGRPRWDTFSQDLRANFIAPEILEYMAKLDARFCTQIGIPNVNIAKESGVSEGEVMANNVDTMSETALRLETLQKSIERVNKMFKLDIKVSYRWSKEVNNGNTFDSVNIGAV